MEVEETNHFLSKKIKWAPFLRQIHVCVTVWCFYFISGLSAGTPTVVRPQIVRQYNSTTIISDNMFSWIASISSFSGTCCIIVLILLAHFFGRKKITILLTLIKLTAASVLCFSVNAMHIFISQLLYGIISAGIMTVFPMVITEYSSTEYRGIFLTLRPATFFWGIWTANAIGIFTHYRYIGILSIVISSYAFVTSFFMPESPYWLASKSKYDECVLAHRILKGDGDEAEKELDDMISAFKGMHRKNTKKSIQQHLRSYFKLVRQPEIWKPAALSLLVFSIYDFSGKYVFAVYAIELMKKLTGEESVAHITVLVLDGFSVLGMYIGAGMSKILKRRTMLLVNSAIGITFLLVLSLYLYLIKLSILSENSYAIIVLLVGYSLAICCGPMIMSTSIFGELVPMKARSFSVCVITSLYMAFNGTVTKIAPMMFQYLGLHGSFLVYGLCCSVCLILAFKYLPETKDKSLYEIAALFEKRKSEKTAETKLLELKNMQQ